MWVLLWVGCDRCEDVCDAWLLNESGATSPRLGHLEDVTAVTEVDEGGVGYVLVTTEGIPSYVRTVTDDDLAVLEAADGWRDDGPTVGVGAEVLFGDDIGFDSDFCGAGQGDGYWPPGGSCPEAQARSWYVPRNPIIATDEVCTVGSGAVGLWLNGVTMAGWWSGDATDDTWRHVADEATDLCDGHAIDGEYLHRAGSVCLEDQVGAGEVILGFAADGYPVYGGEETPCWVARDYDDPDDPLGCGGIGERRCLLVDPMDPAAGTEATAFPGPDSADAPTGAFAEDYWFDAACDGLDEHNGHDHGGLGYHYHLTSTFPFTAGPTLRGRVFEATEADCL